MKQGRKFSIREAIIAVALIAAGLAVVRWNDPAVRYRRTGEGHALYAVLKDRLRNGVTFEGASQILGPGNRVADPKFLKYAVANALSSPEGARATDAFYTWKSTGWDITLQFRDGKLINHNPSVYPLADPSFIGR